MTPAGSSSTVDQGQQVHGVSQGQSVHEVAQGQRVHEAGVNKMEMTTNISSCSQGISPFYILPWIFYYFSPYIICYQFVVKLSLLGQILIMGLTTKQENVPCRGLVHYRTF